jgi:CysZ protein
MFKGLAAGFVAPLNGIRFLKAHPKLLVLASVPFVANVLVLFMGLGYVINNSYWIDSMVTKYGFAADAGWFFLILHTVLKVLAWLTLVIFVSLAGYFVGQLVASPFSSLLAEQTLITSAGMPDRPFQVTQWLKLSLRMLKVTFIKAVIFLSIGTMLFMLSFFPFLTIFCHMGLLLMLAFDCADYSFESLGMGFRQRISFFLANFFGFLGFAFSMGVILLIPGLNFFLFPASVVGASLLVGNIRKEKAHGN